MAAVSWRTVKLKVRARNQHWGEGEFLLCHGSMEFEDTKTGTALAGAYFHC